MLPKPDIFWFTTQAGVEIRNGAQVGAQFDSPGGC